MKLKNYYRRHYPRSGFHLFHLLHQFLFHVLTYWLTHLRNSKWASFLGTLHPQTKPILEDRQVLHDPYMICSSLI